MNCRLLIVTVLGGLFVVSASAQETAVAELGKEDSAKAADLYKRLKTAEQEWAAFKSTVQQKYGSTAAKGLPRDHITRVQDDDPSKRFEIPLQWGGGIEFSSDFRFVVPLSRP